MYIVYKYWKIFGYYLKEYIVVVNCLDCYKNDFFFNLVFESYGFYLFDGFYYFYI